MPSGLKVLVLLPITLVLEPAAAAAAQNSQSIPPTTALSTPAKVVDVKGVRGSQSVAHELQGHAPAAGEVVTKLATTRSRGARPQVYYATFPQLVTQADATRCVRVVRRAFPSEAAARTAEDTQNVLWRISAQDYPLCQRVAVPDSTPAAEAASFWRVVGEDMLPKPSPRIAPGYMLAGKLAYLEAGSEPTARFAHDTPLGPLTIEATSTLYVDWGDGGGLDGPHHGPGGPWPNGTITHSWTTAKSYDVRVVQRWSATWRLGAADSGQLVGLSTEGVIDDFEVRQLQAVRNN